MGLAIVQRIIENHGVFHNKGYAVSEKDALDDLISRVKSYTPHPYEKIYQALDHAVSHDNLTCRQENGRRRWQWVDYL